LVTLGAVTMGALLSLLAAVAVARFRFRLRTAFILLLMVIQMVPMEAMIISIFINFRQLQEASGVQMLGNLTGILIVYTAVSLPYYFGRFGTEWGSIMAASTLLTIPVMVFFLFVQRRMVSGLTMGAVKG